MSSIAVAPSPTSSATTIFTTAAASPTQAPKGALSSSSKVSAGTAAGIGVGSAAIVVVILAWLWIRERRKRTVLQKQASQAEASVAAPPEYAIKPPVHAYPSIHEAVPALSPQELPGTIPWHEAPGDVDVDTIQVSDQ
jgi:hypothetical protein